MIHSSDTCRVRIAEADCLTAFGNSLATLSALLRGERALAPKAVFGAEGGDAVPLALLQGRALDETAPPAWLAELHRLLAPVSGPEWGTPRRPVCVTSSNFGVGSLHAYRRTGDNTHAGHGTPHSSVELVRRTVGWGACVTVLSHACVSASLGLFHAARLLNAGLADSVLVVGYDFLSPFVAGGFHALKILNAEYPAPYQDRPTGAIGLGDGAGYAVLTRDKGDFALEAHSLHNEMFHFTANQPDGGGFAAVLTPVAAATAGRKVWVKGHGTGTLEAGRLEAAAISAAFPDAPLVGWKGSIGHTLGSCGLVELALALGAIRGGRTPGTVGTNGPTFTQAVALEPFSTDAYDAVVCSSNAFGGAHAAMLICHA